jgi:alpha-beta hydrolase superfamily lysophospholipase
MMIASFVRALGFWLAAIELVVGQNGWWGLSWLGRGARRALLALPLAAPLGMPGGRARRRLAFGLAAPVALVLQLLLSSLRNRSRDPRSRLRAGEHADRRVDDLRIPLADQYLPGILVAPPAGAQAVVCVLHGSGDHKAAYTWWMVDALLARGLAVLLVDLDGHGANPRVQQFPDILDDVSAAVGWLRARYARVGLLGLSLGGCVAARAAAEGAALDALVLMEAPPILQYTRADMRREALRLLHWPALAVFEDSTPLQLIDTWSTAPIRAAISTWDLIAALDLLGSLARLRGPLLLVYGGSDAIVKPGQAEQVRAAAPPQAEFQLVPGASHLTLFLRRDVQARVAEWFARQLGAASAPLQSHSP